MDKLAVRGQKTFRALRFELSGYVKSHPFKAPGAIHKVGHYDAHKYISKQSYDIITEVYLCIYGRLGPGFVPR
jgi:hypothetical protein